MKRPVTDALWQRLEPLLPPPSPRRFAFPAASDSTSAASSPAFSVLKTGMALDDLPAELGYGCGKTCREYLKKNTSPAFGFACTPCCWPNSMAR